MSNKIFKSLDKNSLDNTQRDSYTKTQHPVMFGVVLLAMLASIPALPNNTHSTKDNGKNYIMSIPAAHTAQPTLYTRKCEAVVINGQVKLNELGNPLQKCHAERIN